MCRDIQRESVDHSGVFVDKTCKPMTGSTLRADMTDSTGHPTSGSIRVAEESGRGRTHGRKWGALLPNRRVCLLDELPACCSSAPGQHMVKSAAIIASQLALTTLLHSKWLQICDAAKILGHMLDQTLSTFCHSCQ